MIIKDDYQFLPHLSVHCIQYTVTMKLAKRNLQNQEKSGLIFVVNYGPTAGKVSTEINEQFSRVVFFKAVKSDTNPHI